MQNVIELFLKIIYIFDFSLNYTELATLATKAYTGKTVLPNHQYYLTAIDHFFVCVLLRAAAVGYDKGGLKV